MSGELLLDRTACRGCFGLNCPQDTTGKQSPSYRLLALRCMPTERDSSLAARLGVHVAPLDPILLLAG